MPVLPTVFSHQTVASTTFLTLPIIDTRAKLSNVSAGAGIGADVVVEVDAAEVVCCDGAVVDELIESYRDCARCDAIRLSRLVAVADATPVARYAPMEVSCA